MDPNRTQKMVKAIEDTRFQFSKYAMNNGDALMKFLEKCATDGVQIPPTVSEFAKNFYNTMEQVDEAYAGLLVRITDDIKRTDVIFEKQQDYILNDVAKLAQENPFTPDLSNPAFQSLCMNQYLSLKSQRSSMKRLEEQATKAKSKLNVLHLNYHDMKSNTIPKALARLFAINKRMEDVKAKNEQDRRRKELLQQRRIQMETISRQYQEQLATTMMSDPQLNSRALQGIAWDSEDLSNTVKHDEDDLYQPGNDYEEDYDDLNEQVQRITID